MKAYDLVELAGRNLREAVLRNSLTTIGIAVGVASLVAMLSLGAGLQQMFGNRLGNRVCSTTSSSASKQDSVMEDRRARSQYAKPSESRRIRRQRPSTHLRSCPGVKEVYPEIRLLQS